MKLHQQPQCFGAERDNILKFDMAQILQ